MLINREQALDEITIDWDVEGYEPSEESMTSYSDTINLVAAIYDSFEAQICGNCKHYRFSECLNLPTYVHVGKYSLDEEQMYLEVESDFGCSQFKPKINH